MKSPKEKVEEPPNAQDATGRAPNRTTSLESWIRGVVLIEKTVAGLFLLLIVISKLDLGDGLCAERSSISQQMEDFSAHSPTQFQASK